MDPPAPLSASSSSSAACFIIVRSSGGGISASEFVVGKKPALGSEVPLPPLPCPWLTGFSGGLFAAGRSTPALGSVVAFDGSSFGAVRGSAGVPAAGVGPVRVGAASSGCNDPIPMIVDFPGRDAFDPGVAMPDEGVLSRSAARGSFNSEVNAEPAFSLAPTNLSITAREFSSILMNFTPMPPGRSPLACEGSRFHTTRPTPAITA